MVQRPWSTGISRLLIYLFTAQPKAPASIKTGAFGWTVNKSPQDAIYSSFAPGTTTVASSPITQRDACTTPFTTFGRGSPFNAMMARFAAVSRNFRTAVTLTEAMCDATITFSIFRIG